MIARKSALIFLNSVFVAIFGFIALFFIARYMGPEPLGILGFGLATVGLASIFSDLGFSLAHVKRVSEGKDIGKCIGTFAVIKVILTGITTVGVLGVIFFWNMFLNRSFTSSTHEIVVYIFLINFIFLNISSIATGTFGARKEIAKSQISQFIASLVQTPALIFVAITGMSVIALAGAYTLAAIILLIVSFYIFRGYPISIPNREYFSSYFRFALPVMLVTSLAVIQMNVDKLMLQFFWNTQEVGYYFSAQRIIDPLLIISASVMALLLPTISTYHAKNDIESIRALTHLAERYLSMVVMPIAVLIMVFADPIIRFTLGQTFLPATPILQILIFVALIAAINRPYAAQLMGINRPDIAAKLGVLASIVNIFLNLLLIPEQLFGIRLFGLGAVGAAMATTFSWAIGIVAYRVILYRLTGTKLNGKVLLHIFAAGTMGGIFYYFNILVFITKWYHLLGFFLIGLSIYFVILFIIREVKREDLAFFRDTTSITEMKNYISSELKNK